MAYPQSTLEAIVASECSMFFEGEARYGRHFKHARAATMYLSLCVVSVDHARSDTFGRLFSLMKKQHTLAFPRRYACTRFRLCSICVKFSKLAQGPPTPLRTRMFGVSADIDPFGIMDPSKKLAKNRYRWLDKNYPSDRNGSRTQRGRINNQTAHANIVSADATFRVGQTTDVVDLPFFDAEDEYFVQTDLWLISSVAIKLMGLFYLVKEDVARTTGRSVLEFCLDFPNTIGGLAAESNALLDEIKGSDRYKTAM